MGDQTLRERLVGDLDMDCYGCSPSNRWGLHLDGVESEDGGVEADWQPRQHFEGWPGFLHGGVLSALCDELTGWAATLAFHQRDGADARPIVTAEYTMRFLAPSRADRLLHIHAWVSQLRERDASVEATIDSEGAAIARCSARYVRLRQPLG
jgi:acyl-coenzyme A thioesterase PaaI-like protein